MLSKKRFNWSLALLTVTSWLPLTPAPLSILTELVECTLSQSQGECKNLTSDFCDYESEKEQ